jgi:hypothetical protein
MKTKFTGIRYAIAGVYAFLIIGAIGPAHGLSFDQLRDKFFENQKKIKTCIVTGTGVTKTTRQTDDGIVETSQSATIEIHTKSPDCIKTIMQLDETLMIVIQKSGQKSQKIVTPSGSSVIPLSAGCDFYANFFNLGLSERTTSNESVGSVIETTLNGTACYEVKINYSVPVAGSCDGSTPTLTERKFYFKENGEVIRFVEGSGTTYTAQHDVTYEEVGNIHTNKSLSSIITNNGSTNTVSISWSNIELNVSLPDNDFNL